MRLKELTAEDNDPEEREYLSPADIANLMAEHDKLVADREKTIRELSNLVLLTRHTSKSLRSVFSQQSRDLAKKVEYQSSQIEKIVSRIFLASSNPLDSTPAYIEGASLKKRPKKK